MPDNLPIEIQEQIIKRLPVKSLIRSQSVCKSWKSLIESSNFITNYSTQQQHLLMYDEEYDSSDPKYVSIVDDDTFPEHRVFVTVPPSVRMLGHSSMKIGSCHGLLCLYRRGRVVIWNPSIRKTVTVVLPKVTDDKMHKTVLGFGVCRGSDPKIVKITYMDKDVKSVASIIWQVEVFTLSTGAWRSRYGSGNLPNKAMYFGDQQNVDGVCYWIGTDRSTVNDEIQADKMIISFDMITEEFGEVKFPESFAYKRSNMGLFNVRESLVAVQCRWREDVHALVYNLWMVENGVPKSFTELYTIHTPDAEIRGVYEFRKSGEPVIEVDYDTHRFLRFLAVYEPNSKHISNLGSLNGINEGGFVVVHSYHMETLLLLDQPSFTVFDKGERYVESFKEES